MIQRDLLIENTGVQGQGVGRTENGEVVFVPGALPGDRVRVQFPAGGTRFVDGTLIEILEKSSQRVDPGCIYFGLCGGCDWLDWDYEAQLEAKQKTLDHSLKRAGWEPKVRGQFLPAAKREGFRTRIQVRRCGENLGFYRKRTHEIVSVESCVAADPKINEALATLRRQPSATIEEKLELYLDAKSGEVHCVTDESHGKDGFTQGNSAQNIKLRELIADRIGVADAKCVLELYCGDGNLSFAYAPLVKSVQGFDGNGAAIVKANLAPQSGFDAKLSFDVASVDERLARQLGRNFALSYDTLLVDPPRKGMGGSLNAFLFGNIRTLIYVSCSPVAFSKDTRGLSELGFSLEYVQGIDMFPHTHHIEFVAHFSRSVC
ncbi:MAG: class I SAM-dependent RNA methyltransferase [Bdellovibrionales bacterium]|nr:class I SAM-dependent RNA methyltransferase [Bdellovibrionales bacterium]